MWCVVEAPPHEYLQLLRLMGFRLVLKGLRFRVQGLGVRGSGFRGLGVQGFRGLGV